MECATLSSIKILSKTMLTELEKLKKEILPNLDTDFSIGLQKSIVQYELNHYNESLALMESTLNDFVRQIYYAKEFPDVQEPKSISEMIRELKAKEIDMDREITSQLFRIESKKKESSSVDQVLMDSCWIGCFQIFELYLKQTKQTSEKIKQNNLEISKYILEELREIYTEDLDENQMKENWERLKPLLDSHPHHKEIIELSLYYLSELDPKQLPGMANTIINQKQTSIRISATLVFLLAEGNFFDQGLNSLELFEKEYPNEPEILYARAFLFLKRYLQKGRRKDLELADSTLSEDYKGQDPFFGFIHSVYRSLKADNPEHKKYVIQKNLGVYLKKGSRLLPELLKTQKEIVVEPIVREEPRQEMRLEIPIKEDEIEKKTETGLVEPSTEMVQINEAKKRNNIIIAVFTFFFIISFQIFRQTDLYRNLIYSTSNKDITISDTPQPKLQDTPANAKDWSAYMGSMTWDQANAKCKSIGMRLPTIDELKAAYKADITKSWQNDGNYYWSSTPYDAERYYLLGVYNGNTNNNNRNNNNNVRCRR